MSKAFDLAGIDKILEAVAESGIGGSLLKWIEEYLNGRSQFVKILQSQSERYYVTSGVPQGSHLGPLFFVLLMNNLPLYIKNAFVLIYADDVKLFLPVKSVADCEKLQCDLKAFSAFTSRCNLNINSDKCAVITFTKCSNPIAFQYELDAKAIARVTSIKDLGVQLDAGLTFNDHVNTIVSEGLTLYAVIKRFGSELDEPYTIKALYVSLVRSKMEFASVVWRPMYSVYINKLEAVQKKFVTYAVRNLGWTEQLPEYKALCSLLDLDTLENRHRIADITFFLKIQRGIYKSVYLSSRILPNRRTVTLRYRRPFIIENRTTNYHRNEPAHRFMREVNNFSRSVINLTMSIEVVKSKLSLFLRGQLYVV